MYGNRMKTRVFAIAALTLTLAFAPLFAFASTATATFAVSATVVKTCIVSSSGLAFGNYTGIAITNTTGTISVTCTNTTPYTVTLSQGASGSYTGRYMTYTSGSTTYDLNYQLYTTSSDGNIFGDNNSDGTSDDTGTGSGSAQTITVYGVVAAGQYPPPGAYSDSLTATVTY